MSRMVNSNVAGMRKQQQQQQQQQNQTKKEMSNSFTDAYKLVPDQQVSNDKKRKRTLEKEEGEMEDVFYQNIRVFSENPNLGYVNQQTNQINLARGQQKHIKDSIMTHQKEREARNRSIREVYSVPSHMNISPIQYYPRPHLNIARTQSSSAATQASRPSCASNYRTHIPHEEKNVKTQCKEKTVINSLEDFEAFLAATKFEPIYDEDNDDNEKKDKKKDDNTEDVKMEDVSTTITTKTDDK